MDVKNAAKAIASAAFFYGCCIFGVAPDHYAFPACHIKTMLITMTQSAIRMRFPLLALACCLFAGALPHASAQGIFLCVDANGRRELTDVNRRGCKEISMPGVMSTPVPATAGMIGGGAPRVRTPSAPIATPANFPRVDTAQQKARDNDRREILNDELRSEERKLADMRREFNGGEPERQGNERNYAKYQERVGNMRDSIGRAEKNIEALRREIGGIK